MFYNNGLDHEYLQGERAMLELKRKASVAGQKASLAKAVSVIGTPPDPNNDIAIFVPEDLQKFWSAETVRNQDIVLSRKLPMVEAFSTLHKWTVVEQYGGRYTTHFFSEDGSLPSVNKSKSRSGEVELKLFGERRQIGNLAEVVGQIGGINPGGPPMVSRSGRARETANAIRSEIIAYEQSTIWGDSDVDPLEFDGVVKQLKTKGTVGVNVHDLRGAPLSFSRLLVDIAKLRGKPYSAKVEEICLDDEQWASLAIETTDSARWARAGSEFKMDGGWTFNPIGMYLLSPRGEKTVFTIVPFLAPDKELPAAAEGTPAATLSYGADVTSIDGDTGSGSLFLSGDAGVYKYAIKAVFRLGTPVHFTTPNVTVAAGDIVTCIMDDAAIGDSTNPLLWYEIWRTDKTGAVGTLAYLKRVPAKNESGHTEWTDGNELIPGKGTVLGLQFSELAMFRASLLPPVRFPIPYAGFAKDFIIARCDAPVVSHYHRQLIYYNCGLNTVAAA